jgi:dTDP-4-dehydrorhamnose 3,5-epimerase
VETNEPLPGCLVKRLTRRADARGALTELFREDELPEGFRPVMAYLSVTHPGVARGPHEHREQCDGFAFVDGEYALTLWENRAGRKPASVTLSVGENNPVLVLVPPGVVHAYKNVGERDAFVLNFPDKLYAGWGRAEEVDEIRHEADPGSPFNLP